MLFRSEEFGERLDKAYAAKTLGELDDLMADLPAVGTGPLPGTSLERPAAGPPLAPRSSSQPVESGRGRLALAWRAAWGSWLGISLLLLVIWLASGAGGGLWFLWVAVALGALMLGRQITGAPGRRERRPAQVRRSRRYRDSGQAR